MSVISWNDSLDQTEKIVNIGPDFSIIIINKIYSPEHDNTSIFPAFGRRGNLIMILQEERHQVWELQSNLWLPTLLLTLGTGKQLQQLHHHQLQSALPRNYQISYYTKSYKSWQN